MFSRLPIKYPDIRECPPSVKMSDRFPFESVPVNPYVLQKLLTLANTGRTGTQAKVAELVDALDSKSSLAHTR